MKLWLSALAFILSFPVCASVGQIAVKGGSWSFQTENVRTTSESSSGFGAYAFEIAYGLTPKLQGVFGVNFLMSEVYTGSSGYGFDLGAKYFPWTDSGSISIESGSSSIFIQEKWRPFVGFFFRQRLFNLASSTSYLGPGISLGTDYAWKNNWFFSGEVRYDYLYGEGDALAKQINLLIGLGREF